MTGALLPGWSWTLPDEGEELELWMRVRENLRLEDPAWMFTRAEHGSLVRAESVKADTGREEAARRAHARRGAAIVMEAAISHEPSRWTMSD